MSDRLARKLSFLDRYLTVWIFLAMIGGVAIGHWVDGAPAFIQRFDRGAANVRRSALHRHGARVESARAGKQ